MGVAGDPTPLTTTRQYDTAGRLVKTIQPAGNGMSMTYDASDRVTAVDRLDASGSPHEQLAFSYNNNDQVTERQAQICSGSCAGPTTTWSALYTYDPSDANLVKITSPVGSTNYKTFSYISGGPVQTYNDENHQGGTADYSYTYDVSGRRLMESRYLYNAANVVTQYSYDLHDNVSTVTDPNGNVTTYAYDDFDRVSSETSPVQGVTSYTYDADSNLLTTTDSNMSVTTDTFDSLNRKLTEIAAIPLATPMQSSWTYDDTTTGHLGIGHLSSMSDPSGSTTYTYERHGNVAIQNLQIVLDMFTQYYTYDKNANQAAITYPDGYVVTTGYDFADRASSSTHTSTIDAQQLRALSERGIPVRYHTPSPEAPTRRATLPSPIAPPSHVRRLVAGQQVLGGGSITRTGGASRIAPPGIVGPHRAGQSDNFVTSATYEPFGPLNVIVYGNGTTQTLSWTNRYFPMENKLSATATIADFAYGEDAVGNIKTITDNINAAYDRNFAYDDLNRLTTANSGTGLWGTASGNGYSYDPMGNLKGASGSTNALQLGSARTEKFIYVAGSGGSLGLPKISSVSESYGIPMTRLITYDPFGNETSDFGGQAGSKVYGYSARELLASDSNFTSSDYYYDGFRQRVATSTAGLSIDSFFDQSHHLLAETSLSATPSVAYKYVWLGNRPVAQVDSNGTHWTFADHLGTPIIQTDTVPTVTWQAEYEPYGRIWALRTGSNVYQPLRFPGQVAEQLGVSNNQTGRDYNNARWYRPAWGRYTQADALGARENTEEYGYAMDDPEDRTDIAGLEASVIGCVPIFTPNPPMNICIPAIPQAKQFALSGKFCGPGYAFGILGFPEQFYPMSAYAAVNPDKLDPEDRCCLTHDACLAGDAQPPHCHKQPNEVTCACDHALGKCERGVKPNGFVAQVRHYAFMGTFPTGGGGPNCPDAPRPDYRHRILGP